MADLAKEIKRDSKAVDRDLHPFFRSLKSKLKIVFTAATLMFFMALSVQGLDTKALVLGNKIKKDASHVLDLRKKKEDKSITKEEKAEYLVLMHQLLSNIAVFLKEVKKNVDELINRGMYDLALRYLNEMMKVADIAKIPKLEQDLEKLIRDVEKARGGGMPSPQKKPEIKLETGPIVPSGSVPQRRGSQTSAPGIDMSEMTKVKPVQFKFEHKGRMTQAAADAARKASEMVGGGSDWEKEQQKMFNGIPKGDRDPEVVGYGWCAKVKVFEGGLLVRVYNHPSVRPLRGLGPKVSDGEITQALNEAFKKNKDWRKKRNVIHHQIRNSLKGFRMF